MGVQGQYFAQLSDQVGVRGRSAEEIRRCLWRIVEDRPTGRYLTWEGLSRYLRLPYSSVTVARFAAGGDDQCAYRASNYFLRVLNEALNDSGV